MGEIARTVVRLGGKDRVTGVIPESLLGRERPGVEDVEGKGKEREKKLPRNWARRMGWVGGGKADQDTDKAKLLLDEEYGQVLIVPDLQARKKKMIELIRDGGPGSGFVALSGGIGTMDELFEVLSWKQMGVHARGVCVVNVDGFWDGVVGWVGKAVGEGFVRKGRPILGNVEKAEEVVGWLRGYDEERVKGRERKVEIVKVDGMG